MTNPGQLREASTEIRVLYAGAAADTAEATAAALERQNDRFDVRAVRRFNAALEAIHEDDADCVVSAGALKDGHGVELLEAVRDVHSTLPVILFPADGAEVVASRAISADVTDYLQRHSGTPQYDAVADRIQTAVDSSAMPDPGSDDRQLPAVYDRITDGFFVVNADWEYRYANEAGAEIMDCDREDLVGETVWDACPELLDTPFATALGTAMETQTPRTITHYYPPSDAFYDVRVFPAKAGVSIYVTEAHDRQRHRYKAYLENTQSGRGGSPGVPA